MITTLIFDFSRVLIFSKDRSFSGSLNKILKTIQQSTKKITVLDHYVLNTDLLEYADSLKLDYNLYIFTLGRLHEPKEIKKHIDPIFKKIFNAIDLNFSKEDPESYKSIANMIGEKPESIIFIDDDQDEVIEIEF